MLTGKIKKLIYQRGFGFISNEEKEVFFHRSGVEGDFEDLKEGDLVSFEVVPGKEGKNKAIKVKKIKAEKEAGA